MSSELATASTNTLYKPDNKSQAHRQLSSHYRAEQTFYNSNHLHVTGAAR